VQARVGSDAHVLRSGVAHIVDLGLVYECDVMANEDGTRSVEVKITLTAPGCGMGDILVDDVRDKIEQIPTVARRAWS